MMAGVPLEQAREQAAGHHTALSAADAVAEAEDAGDAPPAPAPAAVERPAPAAPTALQKDAPAAPATDEEGKA